MGRGKGLSHARVVREAFRAIPVVAVAVFALQNLLVLQERSKIPRFHLAPLRDVETCAQWRSSNREAGGYLHYILIGAQKSGTSQLSHLLKRHALHQATRPSPKEFHFYDAFLGNASRSNGADGLLFLTTRYNGSLEAIRGAEMEGRGFTKSPVAPEDLRLHPDRFLHGDSTPLYMLSEEIARLVHALHPHIRVLVAIRDPVSRVVSQLNMHLRRGLTASERGSPPLQSNFGSFFDFLLELEMRKAGDCGWLQHEGRVDARYGGYSDQFGHFAKCTADAVRLERESKRRNMSKEWRIINERIKHDLYVLRGLYADILQPWLNYFPSTRLRMIEFDELVCNMTGVLHALEDFLCLPSFPESVYTKAAQYQCTHAKSKGQKGDGYVYPSHKTQRALRHFYTRHNERLRALTQHFFAGHVKLEWGY